MSQSQHQKTHTGEEAHERAAYGKSFSQTCLTQHQKTHLVELIHERRFTTSELREHWQQFNPLQRQKIHVR